jgi:hypothetical protein
MLFFYKKESIQHLLFECPLAQLIWRIICITFGLNPPKNVTNLFGNWLKSIPNNDVIQVRVGVCAIIWALWNTRNDLVFNKPKKMLSCKLFLWLPTRFVYGPISNKRSSEMRWIMGVTVWRR